MNMHTLVAWCVYLFNIPFLIIVMIVFHYVTRRGLWSWRKRRGAKNPGYCPSIYEVGKSLDFLQVLYRPSMAYVLEAERQAKEDADEDDNGDPNSPQARLKHFHRQLTRIRRGDPVDRLQWRL